MEILEVLKEIKNPSIVIIVLIFLLLLNSLIFKKISSPISNFNIAKGLVSLLLVLLGTVIFVLVLPGEDNSLKGNIIAFLGILISGGIALSSTTILSNLIAGIMNNTLHRFRNGDHLKVGDFQGKVVNKGIFHTELQLEDSNKVTIPNLHLVNNPVKVISNKKTVISSSVSLGYEYSRKKVEKALLEAAKKSDLTNPFVFIKNLGDFSIVYEVHGFLENVGNYFSAQSVLNANVLDELHEEKIEIISPSFMNQRSVETTEFIPHKIINEKETFSETRPEDLIFDEANKSEKIENKKDALKKIKEERELLREQLKNSNDSEEVEKLKAQISENKEQEKRLTEIINEQVEKSKDTTK